MTYEQMIQTECTDNQYDAWTDYRREITDYIIDSVQNYYRRRKIVSEKILRISKEYGMKQVIDENLKKPVLAIWGAGGGNDMDLPRLAKYFRLVLIDRDTELLKRTVKRFGLDEKMCACVDLSFWDISHDDYKMIEAMLKDDVPDAGIMKYIEELVQSMHRPDYSKLPHFDFSVCVGVASQLNVRLSMLMTFYGRTNQLAEYMHILNKKAVEQLWRTVDVLTNNMIIYGYEIRDIGTDNMMQTEMTVRDEIYEINQDYEDWLEQPVWPPYDLYTTIAGNEHLTEKLTKAIAAEQVAARQFKTFFWPFTDLKAYVMVFGSFEMLKNQ